MKNIAFALRVTETLTRIIKQKVPQHFHWWDLHRNTSLSRKNLFRRRAAESCDCESDCQ